MRKSWIAKVLVAASITAALVAPAASQAQGCQDPSIKILQPNGGQVIVNGLAVQAAGGQSLTLSTTGTIDVIIEHDCAFQVDLKVTKTAPGSPTVIHTNSWSPLACDKGTLKDVVMIGLDGGNYQFDVNGVSCEGRKLRSDGHGGTVIDPPLPSLI